MIQTIKELIWEQLDTSTHGDFKVTGTPRQLHLLKESIKSDVVNSGLVINAGDFTEKELDNISDYKWGGTTIKFIEGDHFSITHL